MEKRVFIAVKYNPSTRFKESFLSIQHIINKYATVKWVEMENMHVTLCFMGNVLENYIPLIETAMSTTVQKIPAFKTKIEQTGIFKSGGQPTVFWMGIHPDNMFQNLAKELIVALQKEFAGVENNRINDQLKHSLPFRPHLTLGRFKKVFSAAEIMEYIQTCHDQIYDNWEISQIILYESTLTREGPHYHPLHIENLLKN
jgi:2'-5' RNA ligase